MVGLNLARGLAAKHIANVDLTDSVPQVDFFIGRRIKVAALILKAVILLQQAVFPRSLVTD